MDGNELHQPNEFEDAGSNQMGLREHNERLVLTILRRQGPLAKAEIARRTGLSAQTVSVIMRSLEQDGLITKGEKVRGKVGQPSVPMQLNPEGAYFLGLKVGIRSAEMILVNFLGQEISHVTETCSYPTTEKIFEFAVEFVERLCTSSDVGDSIAGLGIASPFFLWEWAGVIGVDPAKMAAWKEFDLCAELINRFDFPIFLGNDATSACGAELTFGTTLIPADFLYIYVGYFVGGGVVLNNHLYTGHNGNAGAVGPFPIIDKDGKPSQLIEKASMIGLEKRLLEHSGDTLDVIFSDGYETSEIQETVAQWLEEALPPLTQLIVGACSIIDFPAIVVDGNMPDELRSEIVRTLSKRLETTPMSGLSKPQIVAGSLGRRARALGAASLPLTNKYVLET